MIRKLWKTLLFIALGMTAMLCASPVFADSSWRYTPQSAIGPVYISTATNRLVALSSTTIAAPGTGLRNCLTTLVATSTNPISLAVLDGVNGTIIYAPGKTAADGNATGSWPFNDPLCGSAGNALVLQSTVSVNGSFAAYSYQGFVGN